MLPEEVRGTREKTESLAGSVAAALGKSLELAAEREISFTLAARNIMGIAWDELLICASCMSDLYAKPLYGSRRASWIVLQQASALAVMTNLPMDMFKSSKYSSESPECFQRARSA